MGIKSSFPSFMQEGAWLVDFLETSIMNALFLKNMPEELCNVGEMGVKYFC